MAKARRRAVFLDRDGVIVEEVDYLRDWRDLRLIPGAARAIAGLRRAGFKVIVVSNQSAVARGLLSLRGLAAIHRRMKARLRRQALGARLDALYYCPHHPRAGRAVFCSCRKPRLGMIRRAVRRFRLDIGASYFVGDSTTDMKTASDAGCIGLLVRTGKAGRDGRYRVKPRKVFQDLAAAAAWVLKKTPRRS